MRAPPRNQKTQSQKRKQSKSLVEVADASNEAKALVIAARDDISLAEAAVSLKEEARNRLRGKRHDVTTNKGVVALLNEAINGFVLDVDGEVISRNELNTLAYTCGIQLRAIQAVQEEETPASNMGNLLSVEIRMTREERKMFLTAGTVDGYARVLEGVQKDGEAQTLEQQSDGTFAITPREDPPRGDAPIALPALSRLLQDSGTDITTGELKALTGPTLGSTAGNDTVADEIEMFGFEDFAEVSPITAPGLGHTLEVVSMEHPGLPGVLIRLGKCTRCGITVRNPETVANDTCGVVPK